MKCIFLDKDCIKPDKDCRHCEVRFDVIALPEYLDGMKRCPRIPGLMIFCAEESCTRECPVYSKESGYLGYAMEQAVEFGQF